MPRKNTSRKKAVNPKRISFVQLADYFEQLGPKVTSRRLGVTPRTIKRWIRDGVPAAKFPAVRLSVSRRNIQLRRHEIKKVRLDSELIAARGYHNPRRKGAFEKRSEKFSEDQQIDDAIYENLKVIMPALREKIDGLEDIGLYDQTRRLRMKMANYRKQWNQIRHRNLARGPYPELIDATPENIDKVAKLLSDREGKSVRFFYKFWRSPPVG